jgi:hypothetical protein
VSHLSHTATLPEVLEVWKNRLGQAAAFPHPHFSLSFPRLKPPQPAVPWTISQSGDLDPGLGPANEWA